MKQQYYRILTEVNQHGDEIENSTLLLNLDNNAIIWFNYVSEAVEYVKLLNGILACEE